jgi:hypothetical protein
MLVKRECSHPRIGQQLHGVREANKTGNPLHSVARDTHFHVKYFGLFTAVTACCTTRSSKWNIWLRKKDTSNAVHEKSHEQLEVKIM